MAAIAWSVITAPQVMAQQYPTIVGEWYAEDYGPQDCGTPQAIHIGPMTYAEDTYVCRFDDVARKGWEVTWNGSCSDGSTRDPMRLVATETDGRLKTSWNGNPGAWTLRRCAAQPAMTRVDPTERLPLTYTAYPADSATAQKYWNDVIEMVATFEPPPVVPVTVQVSEGAGYTFAYVSGGMICGMGNHGCPVRIFVDNRQVGEFSACENLERHAVAADGSRFFGCDDSVGRPMSTLMQ